MQSYSRYGLKHIKRNRNSKEGTSKERSTGAAQHRVEKITKPSTDDAKSRLSFKRSAIRALQQQPRKIREEHDNFPEP
jgi:hypothetical protein